MRRKRWLGVVAAVAACVPLLVSSSGAQEGCPDAEVLKGHRGTWRVMPGPTFGTGEQRISAQSIDRLSPQIVYATNGSAIARTRDAGCTWREVYRLPDAPTTAMPVPNKVGRIQRLQASDGLVVASVSAPGELLGTDAADVATVVTRSGDGGQSWGNGSVLPGAPGPIAFGPSRDDLYVAAGGVVYRGESLSPTAPLGEFSRIASLVASINGRQLWVKPVGGPAFRSEDEGASYRRYTAAEGPGTATAAGPVLGPDLVDFFETNQANGHLRDILNSGNGGETFSSLGASAIENVDGKLQSFDGAQRQGDFVVSTTETIQAGSAGVYRWQPRVHRLVSIDEFALAPLFDVQAPSGASQRAQFVFHTDTELVSYTEKAKGAADLPIPGSIEDFDNPDVAPASLLPDGGEVKVRAGSSRTLPYRLALPARSAILDTFFILDTSNSTEGYINGLRIGVTGIARGLARAGVDARFGLGEYQDISPPSGLRYALRAQIGPADLLRNALGRLRTAGGEEPGYTAVQQALTGSGVRSPHGGVSVPPGQEVHWRKRSLRTMVLVADESFAYDTDGADRDEAVRALKRSGSEFVGVIVYDPEAPPARPGSVPPCAKVLKEVRQSYGGDAGAKRLRCQLEDLARAAGTVAPAGGVDCDGDGAVDIAAGKPLVCAISRASSTAVVAVADPLRRSLIALTDSQPVSFHASGGHVQVSGGASGVDLKEEQGLGVQATFRCGKDDGGERFPVTIGAEVAGRDVASTSPTLVCEAAPVVAVAAAKPKEKEARPAPRPAAPPAPAAAPAPPVLAPAAPAPATVPVPVAPPAYVPPPVPVSAQAPAPAQAPATGIAAAVEPKAETAHTVVHVDEDEPGESLNFSRLGGVAAVLGVVLVWPRRVPRAPTRIPVRDRSEPARRRRRRRP